MKLFAIPGQVAVVTGAAHGIGLATAKLLAEAGASVALLDIDEAGVRAAASDIGGSAAAWACDVTSEARVEAVFAEIAARYGRIDILVNNAGTAVRKPATEISMTEWERVLGLNLGATFFCSRIAARTMQKQGGGSIVNLASIMGFSGGIFPNASYQASKGGVVNLTRALALEWAGHGIRVNAVAPGPILTPIYDSVSQDMKAKILSALPLGRMGRPEEVANVVLFLASDEAAFITGATYLVDGGRLL